MWRSQCGARSAFIPFAPVGTTLPGGLKLEKRKIRGAISEGMLCSARELGLGTDHEGILALTVKAAPGTKFLDAMPVGEIRLVIDVNPNRPDLLSHLGIAREIGAAVNSTPVWPVTDFEGMPGFAQRPRRAAHHRRGYRRMPSIHGLRNQRS
jgi:phenylalanyl-tRNA synthetase beta chain